MMMRERIKIKGVFCETLMHPKLGKNVSWADISVKILGCTLTILVVMSISEALKNLEKRRFILY